MTINFDVAPYFDDANNAIDSNYMRILFKPGKAVQARELTQLQSLLQNQISTVSGFVFKDGSPVHGGHISFDGSVIALTLQQQFANTDINPTDFLVNGNTTLITNASGPVTVKAYVVAIDDTQVNPTLLIKYITANMFNDNDVIQVATGVQTQAQLIANSSSSVASVASINDGVFFSGGFFVSVPKQTIVLSSSNNVPSFRVGLSISESIVDSVSDSTLLDPAQGSFNYQAPGADRYQYLLTLDKRDFSSTDDTAFYELLHLENGLVTMQVEYPIFGDLATSLARRTYDQSGDFTVKPFIITTDVNTANANQYTIIVSPGKAYVKGFEFETVGTQRLNADKALSTNSVTDFTISMEFGNILVVANLHSGNATGLFDIAQYEQVDLHAVTSGQIDTTNASTYFSTYMGTARVRDIEFLGLGDYFAYVTDSNVSSNSFTAAAGNAISFTVPANYTAVANAYANVIVTVNTGGQLDVRTITSYTTGRVAFLDRPLSVNANNTSNVKFNYAIKDLEALVLPPTAFGVNTYATMNASAAIDACMDIALAGKDVAGNTILSDTQFDKLIFSLPQSYIAQNSISNATYTHRKELLGQTFTSGNLTISSGSGLASGESLPYGYTASFLSDNAANNNFLVVVKNAQSSNIANGTVIQFNRGTIPAGNGVFQTDGTHLTVVTSANNSFTADVFFTVFENNATTVNRRTKTLVGNAANTTLVATDSYLNGNVVIGLTNTNSVTIDANGFAWFTNYYDQALSPGARQSLYVPDVFAITKIFDSGSPAHMPNVANAIDITANYYLDSGQRDDFYDHSALILKSGVNPPSGQTVVMMQYFAHDTVLGFFDADSYSANIYNHEQIPYYSSPVFGSFALRDSIDFRPTRAPGTSADINTLTLQGLSLPQPDSTMKLSYQYYLPRIDKLVLNKAGTFQLKEGTPSLYPVSPSDSDDSMTLYILTVPAFTANVKAISLQYIENKRYTMRDIGTLDTRIQQLEYYSALSQLEAQAANEKILYQDNVTAKDQYGILADDFGDFSIADNKSADLRAYLKQGTLSPFKTQEAMKLKQSDSSGGQFKKNAKTYSLAFTETPAINQNTATTTVPVQPFLFGQFTGTMKLSPETDYWFSSTLTPQVIQPASSNPSLPPLPTPLVASALAINSIPIGNWVVASSLDDVVDNWHSGYRLNYRDRPYVDYAIGHLSYGVLSPVNNWFGVPAAKTIAVSQAVNKTPIGASIQLPPGAKLGITNLTPILLRLI